MNELVFPQSYQPVYLPTAVDASQIFANIGQGFFELCYSGSPERANGMDTGVVFLHKIAATPEPTTGTLSLLALAALAARRRK